MKQKIQEILDKLADIASKTPNNIKVEYHLRPDGCYAVIFLDDCTMELLQATMITDFDPTD